MRFAREVIQFAGSLPRNVANAEIARQVVRSSGSVGANYIEANEALSKKDFALRIKICRKEAKESRYWLMLARAGAGDSGKIRQALIGEATELIKIFACREDKIGFVVCRLDIVWSLVLVIWNLAGCR